MGRRVADLLVAEHVALAVARGRGLETPAASIVPAGDRVFLEVERFDRDGVDHRSGQASLDHLDAEFAGTDQACWTASVELLAARGVIPAAAIARVRWLETFGRLIGNTDLHFGNLAFRLDGTRATSLAPIYDMAPMHYHPRQGELPRDDHPLVAPGPGEADVARPVLDAAVEVWTRLADDARVSGPFRELAARNVDRTVALQPRVDALPIGTRT